MPNPLPDIATRFQPDYTPEQLENLGVYDALYRGKAPRIASLGEWKPEWISEHDPKGWAQWYKRYASGRRIPDEDERQIKRWLSFKARHGGPFAKNPTPRRGWALRNWGIDPAKLVAAEQANSVTEMLDDYKSKAMQKYVQERVKQSAEHILVSGHSGAGKSTLTKALADKLQMPYAQVDHQPAFTEFLANNTPDNHLPAGSPKHEEFRRLMRETALKTLDDTKSPSIIEGSQLAYLPPEILANFKRIHVNPSLRQAYQQRLARTKQRYLKDPAKTWTPEVEEEKRRTADMVYDFHRPAFRDYDKLPGTVKYKPGQNLDRLLQRLQKQSNDLTKLAPKWSDRAHLLAALPKHLTDTQTALQNSGNIDKEMTDLALISQAWLKSQKQKELLASRLQKFQETASYPSLAAPPLPELKVAELKPEVKLQDHQQRIQDRAITDSPRMLVYHGLGSGKSLSAIAAAEAARKLHGGNYGIAVPASLRDNFRKEIKKFTTGDSKPEILSYTGLALGKKFQDPPETLIMDEAARLRNPNAASTRAATQAARQAQRVLLLTGTPITNSPGDLAPLVSMLHGESIDPKDFEQRYVGHEKVWPGLWNWLRGIKPGVRSKVKRRDELVKLLENRVDYQPSKTPEGVNVNEEVIRTPLTPEQQKIEKAIRTKIPPGFLWKLDREFPLSKDELRRLNGFLTGLRQVGLSTQAFRADKDPVRAFEQSGKLTTAMKNLRKVLDEDPRKKAIIYSNFIDAGIKPYAAALARDGIPAGVFHGGVPLKKRRQVLDDYNAGKIRALLLGPAAAEGISTKGTSLIQLLDPHWNEARLQQAKGRGLRFDSHRDLPEELKNVAVQRYLNQSEEPSTLGRWLLGKKRHRTADEVLERLTAEKEELNNAFRELLKEVGTRPRPKPEQQEAQ